MDTINLNTFMQIEINIMALLILAIIFLSIDKRNITKKKSKFYYTCLVITNFSIVFCDLMIFIFQHKTMLISHILFHFFAIAYYIAQQFFIVFWLAYVLKRIYPNYKLKKYQKCLILIPNIILCLLTISSPFTNFIYKASENYFYERGSLMPIYIIITYSYALVSMLITIKYALCNKNKKLEYRYQDLILFSFLTLVANIIQLIYFGTTISWIISAIGFLILQISHQKEKIYEDNLTKLYNRDYIFKEYLYLQENIKPNEYLFVIMTDLDNFKSINDKYGHLIGDEALKISSEILKSCGNEKYKVGRFAGDEFLITGIARQQQEILDLIDNIQLKFFETNKKYKLKYNLSISCGHAISNIKNKKSFDEIIKEADDVMYKCKNNKKQIEIKER